MVNFVAQYSIYVITVVFMIICTFLTDKFLTASNLVNILLPGDGLCGSGIWSGNSADFR